MLRVLGNQLLELIEQPASDAAKWRKFLNFGDENARPGNALDWAEKVTMTTITSFDRTIAALARPGRCARLLQTFALVLAVAFLFGGGAQAAPTNIKAELLAEGPALPGETTTLAIHMKPGPGWHGYWLNPGDAGLGMVLDWTLPDGAQAGEPRYPVPQTLVIASLMNHVYKGDYAVLVPLTLPQGAETGARLPISVNAQWLACTDEICVPEQARLKTTVIVGAPVRPDPQFDAWRTKLPAPLDAPAAFAVTDNTIRLAIPLPGTMELRTPHIFAAEDKVADYASVQGFSRTGDRLIIELQRPRFAAKNPESLSGVLRLNEAGDGLSFTAQAGEVPALGKPLESAGMAMAASLPLLLIGALAGGLLLNVMPCVFPILSIKALSLARAGESATHARSEGLAYTTGVITATVALGALMLGLRAAGQEIGWAFQLQEPLVIVALFLLAVAITANFLGLFEVSAPGLTNDGTRRGAFATGLLAAFVATPCTGPFMAAAMGAALLLPLIPALALFATLGLGIALPFLAVAFIPALRRRMPKPGPWMTAFRRWMALPMGLTALALLWLASRVGGMSLAGACIALMLGLLAALILAGRKQRDGKPAMPAVAYWLALLGILAVLVLPKTINAPAPAVSESLLDPQPFSQTALNEARASGKPVFAWFTADWCITCKVNEQAAIEREATATAFRKAGVITLRGDWTRRDPAITRFLTAQGAAGVPLYVWYPANGAPEQLPQVLTQSMLVDRAAQGKTR